MPLSLRRGVVSAIAEEAPGLVRLEVDGIPCIAYPRLTGEVEVGDDVLVNDQARALELGSGGFDVLYANLTRGLGLPPEEGAHVMALPYTPGQLALRRAEEDTELPSDLGGMPVVLCTVHSQVAPVCAALGGKRVAYVQVQGGALPVSLSDTVRVLKDRGLVEAAIAVAPCFDGDFECVSLASALLLAKHRQHDVVVCSVGPGIVGTGTRFGSGALALADAATMASILGGSPILAPRVSEADKRDRHRGMSHHTRTVGELSVGKLTQSTSHRPDLSVWREACVGLPLSHMGRGPDEDAAFFRAAFAAGLTARDMLG